MRGIIYKATFPSGKAYIGQTVQTFAARKANHERDARRGSGTPFHAAIREYGAENIKWEVLARAGDIAALNAAEIACIAAHKTISPNGYNALSGGKNAIPNAETRAKLSAVTKARWAAMSADERAERRVKMLAIAALGNGAKRGKRRSAAARANMSAAMTARWANMTAAARAHHAAKSGEANRGKTRSAEHRAKISAAAKRRWAKIRAINLSTKQKEQEND